MTLASTALVPELQYYINNFVISSVVNKYEVPVPVTVDEIFLTPGTVVELLFADTFSSSTYTYLYKEEDRASWPVLTRQRLMLYPSSKYYIPSPTGGNIFNLQGHDFVLLDSLLKYRQDSTSLTIVDSTSVSFVDSIPAILYANFETLNTPLSKLIYLYLQLKIYNNYSNYNNLNLITTGTLLETCFELKLVDEFFTFMTDREVSFEIC